MKSWYRFIFFSYSTCEGRSSNLTHGKVYLERLSRHLKTFEDHGRRMIYLYHSLSYLDIIIIRQKNCATLASFWSWSMFVTLGRALPKVLPPLQWLRL